MIIFSLLNGKQYVCSFWYTRYYVPPLQSYDIAECLLSVFECLNIPIVQWLLTSSTWPHLEMLSRWNSQLSSYSPKDLVTIHHRHKSEYQNTMLVVTYGWHSALSVVSTYVGLFVGNQLLVWSFSVLTQLQFNSFARSVIGDTEATALADSLRVNQSLRTLRYSNMYVGSKWLII